MGIATRSNKRDSPTALPVIPYRAAYHFDGVLLVAKKLDTSWFDLKNYEAFKTMSTEGWIWQLQARDHYHREALFCLTIKENASLLPIEHNDADKSLAFILDELKPGIIRDHKYYPNDFHDNRAKWIVDGRSFDTASVESLTSSRLWRMTQNNKLKHVWDACQHADNLFSEAGFNDEGDYISAGDLSNDLEEIITAPHDFHIKQYSNFDIEPEAHVVINLSATDEQIKNDFSHWLTHYRKAINYQHKKKLYTQAAFDYWIQYGVIPYLDLTLIARIEGKKITQNQLARLIFPNEYDVDIIGRLRQVTKPEAEQLIKNEIHRTLSTQLVAEKSGMKIS